MEKKKHVSNNSFHWIRKNVGQWELITHKSKGNKEWVSGWRCVCGDSGQYKWQVHEKRIWKMPEEFHSRLSPTSSLFVLLHVKMHLCVCVWVCVVQGSCKGNPSGFLFSPAKSTLCTGGNQKWFPTYWHWESPQCGVQEHELTIQRSRRSSGWSVLCPFVRTVEARTIVWSCTSSFLYGGSVSVVPPLPTQPQISVK